MKRILLCVLLLLCSSCVVLQKDYDLMRVQKRAIINENVELEFNNKKLMIDNSKAMLETIRLRQELLELKKKRDWMRRI